MQLIHIKSGFVILTFQEGETIFHDPFLEELMETNGIPIPLPLQKNFQGKAVVYPKDAEFQQAFKDVYYRLFLNPQTYNLS